ncbi:hypothetical protein HZ994_09205 [Akkermansiaceae bacterium]|nr:hypothetical protein HZ994_09205 [Akkermansiaceae bacterium]
MRFTDLPENSFPTQEGNPRLSQRERKRTMTKDEKTIAAAYNSGELAI